MSKEFVTIEEYLLLKDPWDPTRAYRNYYENVFNNTNSGENLIILYYISKFSFEKYGVEGPPLNSEVFTLKHGTLLKRTFKGEYEKDNKFFYLEGKKKENIYTSIICKEYWWAEIATLECIKRLEERFPKIKRELNWIE